MSNKLKKAVKEFLEGAPSSEGERLWNRWFENPKQQLLDEKIICTKASELEKEIRAIKRDHFRFLGLDVRQLQIAASIIVFVGLSIFLGLASGLSNLLFSPVLIESSTVAGQHRKVLLDDGTQIWLNAGSTLRYPEKMDGDTREVYLEGEAFFDVAKDKLHPFIIHTSHMDTKVLGTSFNVQAYADQKNQEVAVVTGKVNVRSIKTNKNIYVIPGQKAVLVNKQQLEAESNVDLETISTWRKNILTFDNSTVQEAVSTIERNYNVSVKLQDSKLKEFKIKASFEKLTHEQIIKLLCKTIDASYKKEGASYTIYAN